MSQNSIFNNGARGSALSNNANNQQSFPSLSSAILSTSANPTGIDISGTLNSTANTTFRVEFFANSVGDPSGFGEGQFFIGAANVLTDGKGTASFTASLRAVVPVGYVITAIATSRTETPQNIPRHVSSLRQTSMEMECRIIMRTPTASIAGMRQMRTLIATATV